MTGSSQTIRALRCGSIVEPEKFGWLSGPSGPVAEILASRQIPFVLVSGYRQAPKGRFREVPVLPKPSTMERRIAVEEMLRVD
jgi:hypothetical protein